MNKEEKETLRKAVSDAIDTLGGSSKKNGMVAWATSDAGTLVSHCMGFVISELKSHNIKVNSRDIMAEILCQVVQRII